MQRQDELLQDVMILSRAAQLVLQEAVLASLREPALGATKMSLMRLLRRTRRQSVNDLARFIGQTKAAASQNIDSLVKAGFARREPDDADRRCVWIYLTPRGKRVLRKAEQLQRGALAKAIEGMPETTLRRLSPLMRDLANSLLASSSAKVGTCLQCCAYNTAGCVYEKGSWGCQYRTRGGVRQDA